jgi:GTP-binding protein EngB required for normal cell division
VGHPGPTTDSTVEGLLGELAALLPASGRDRLTSARERLTAGRLRVLMAGESKRGKSTLLNALLEREVLPMGVLPVTSVTTTVRFGLPERVDVAFLDGRVEAYAGLGSIQDFVTEAGNPANKRAVDSVTVRTSHPLLAAGLELVDTPGTGSVHEHNTAEARRALADLDLAVFVVSVAPPVSATELELLSELRAVAIEVLAVLTKADLLERDELRAVVGFTGTVLGEALGRSVTVHPTSARQALAARASGDRRRLVASGVPELTQRLRAAAADRAGLLRASAASQGARLAEAASAEAEITVTAAELSVGDLARRQGELTSRLAEVRRLAAESAALLAAEIRRLVAETTEQARQEAEKAIAAARDAIDRWEADRPGVGGCQLEDGAREAGTTAGAERLIAWSDGRRTELDEELTAVTDRLQRRLAEHLEAVRRAASEVFDVPTSPDLMAGTLLPPPSLRLVGTAPAGPTDLLAAAVRTRLPGRAGRRRVLSHLHDDVAQAVEQMFGRARASFQADLQEVGRQLGGATRARVGDSAQRVQAAVDRGSRLAESRAAERLRGLAAERARACTLRQLAGELRSAVGEPGR